MGLFDLNQRDEKPDAKKGNAEKPDATKQEEIGKMGGFSNIRDVAAAAPSSVVPDAATAGRKGASSATPATRETAKERETRLKAEQRAAAMQRVGRYWAKRLSNIPFDTWARIIQDADMKLTDDEAKELAEDYFMTAEAFEIDPTNKWVLLCGLIFTNGALVSARLKKLQDKAEIADAALLTKQ